MCDLALYYWSGRTIEGAETYVSWLTYPHTVNIYRRDLGLDDEIGHGWNYIQQRCPGTDDASDGVHGHAYDHAVLGRANNNPTKAVLKRSHALSQIEYFGLHLSERGNYLRAEILVELDDLQLGLTDLQTRFGDFGLVVGYFCTQHVQLSLLIQKPLLIHKPFRQ